MGSMDRDVLEGLKCMKICRPAPQTSANGIPLTLETVASYTLELDIGDRRGFSSLTLREVPLFLLDAFNLLRQRGLNVEGLFRKEGNCCRLKNAWPIYFGNVAIPEDWTTHDICSMIKRFFRELKTPVFANVETTVLDIASTSEDEVRVEKILDTLRMLPPSHVGTIAFLMRQLKYFGDNHDGHHMTVDNLARVFAPTLFRDDGPMSNGKKKKKGSQERLLSVLRSDNDVKTMIVKDLIVYAQRVGLPRDYYIASRRPSDVGRLTAEKMRHMKGHGSGSSIRSSSAKPLSRSSLHHNAVAAARKEKHEDRYLYSNGKSGDEPTKMRQGRRSSSTVREIISSISNKVLRRGASPGRGLGLRRASADSSNSGGVSDAVNKEFYCMAPTDLDKTPVSCNPDGATHVTVAGDDEVQMPPVSVVTFQSGEDHLEKEVQITAVVFDNDDTPEELLKHSSGDEAEQTITLLEADSKKVVVTPTTVGDPDKTVTSTTSQRRSRRESPRKHLTANSKVKPMETPKLNSSSWMPSPAFEPSDMSTKRLGDISVKRKESGEKRSHDGKTVRRNSSKKSNGSVENAAQGGLQGFTDQATSFMEERLRTPGKQWERRRRHTTPVKTSSMLRRNQPNTIASGLKNPQRARDRRSTTLSFRTTKQESSENIVERKKRRSESLCGNTTDDSIDSNGENDRTILAARKEADSSLVLEQKGIESRQRRAKRQKRKQQGSKKSADSSELPFTSSLLDDVTNEIERLERERKGGVRSPTVRQQHQHLQQRQITSTPRRAPTQSSGAVTAIPAFVVPSVDQKTIRHSEVANAHSSVQSTTEESSAKLVVSRATTKRVTSFGQADRGRTSRLEASLVRRSPSARNARESGHPSLIPSTSTPVRSQNPRTQSPYFAKPLAPGATTSSVQQVRKKSSSAVRTTRRSRERAARERARHDENDFTESERWKREIISRKNGPDDGNHSEVTVRPSVAFLKSNNRGMVQQRVNQFAQMVGQAGAVDSTASPARTTTTRSGCLQQDIAFLTAGAGPAFEFVKPTAPPVTHGLRPAEKRLTFSPPCKGNVASRAKQFEELRTHSRAASVPPPRCIQRLLRRPGARRADMDHRP